MDDDFLFLHHSAESVFFFFSFFTSSSCSNQYALIRCFWCSSSKYSCIRVVSVSVKMRVRICGGVWVLKCFLLNWFDLCIPDGAKRMSVNAHFDGVGLV